MFVRFNLRFVDAYMSNHMWIRSPHQCLFVAVYCSFVHGRQENGDWGLLARLERSLPSRLQSTLVAGLRQPQEQRDTEAEVHKPLTLLPWEPTDHLEHEQMG